MKDFIGAELKVGDYIITYKNSLGEMMYGKVYFLGTRKVHFIEVEMSKNDEGEMIEVDEYPNFPRNRIADRTIKIKIKE